MFSPARLLPLAFAVLLLSNVRALAGDGIVVNIPDKYTDRFERWKTELLSTEFGRSQWEQFADRKGFRLVIRIDPDRGKGAGTGRFEWDNDGKLVGATITIGTEIDQGVPEPVYYPVLSSINADDLPSSLAGRILAATKLSHEFGHVTQALHADADLVQLQDKLFPEYSNIFLRNGRDAGDRRLLDMAAKMGGTPTEIWASREYWSEVDAMHYLQERTAGQPFHCSVMDRIKRNLDDYSPDYRSRFDLGFDGSHCR